jgi:membrane-associated phospholipid phosphatase
VLVVLAVAAVGARPAAAQESERRFTRTDASVLATAMGASALLIGWDRQVSRSFRESTLQDNRGVRGVMDIAGLAGDPGGLVIGAGLWVNGKLADSRTRELLGARSVEAIVLSGLVTGAGKALFGRARPDHSPGGPRDFVLGRGVGDRSEFQSFPSGHATAAFAFASAIDAELDRLAPDHSGWIVPLLYGVASVTAVSRVYHDRHWASDVVLGSAIGFVGGRAVVRWHNDTRDKR